MSRHEWDALPEGVRAAIEERCGGQVIKAEAPEMGAAFTKALEIAQSIGDTEYQLRALRGLYYYHAATGRYRTALPFAQRLHDLAMKGPDPNDRLFGERMMGVAKHYIGDHDSARRHLQLVPTFLCE